MALWTASLFDRAGVMRAGLGYGMYAQGDTQAEAIADATRQLMATVDPAGLTGPALEFVTRTNAMMETMKAEGFSVTVRRKR